MQLAPLRGSHAAATLRWVSDPEIAGGIGLRSEPSAAATAAFIARAEAEADIDAFAILAAGEHVGNVVLDQIDRHLATTRLSIYIGEADARGRGIGREATERALDHAFGALALHKVWLIVHERNAAAIGAYERCGFRLEGRLRGEFLLAGERIDALRMGVLAAERQPGGAPS